MFSPGASSLQVLDVADLVAAIDRDRRRQPGVEELALVVADDDHGIRRHLVELPAERVERARGTCTKRSRRFSDRDLAAQSPARAPAAATR